MATPKRLAHFTVSTTFLGAVGGDLIEYHQGEVVDEDDPALKKWPEYFTPLVVRAHLKLRGVEQATAAPGEKRG